MELANLESEITSLEKKLFESEGRVERKSAQISDLATMGAMITSILDIEQILSAMMEMAIRSVKGEVGCFMLQENDKLHTKISWGIDDRVVRSIEINDDYNIADWTFEKRETVVIDKFNRSSSEAIINTVIASPVTAHNKNIGVIVIVNKTTNGNFDEEDKSSLEMIVRFAAVAIENSQLLKEHLEKQKMEQEMLLAREVQQALLPDPHKVFEKAVINACYHPAGQVGGDYFDILKVSKDEFIVIVGDVSNKGVPAALMMSAIRCAFRMKSSENIKPHQLISDLNLFLCTQILKPDNMFISLVYAYFDMKKMCCTYVNTGHLPPIHFNSNKEDYSEWRIGGTILGQFDDFKYKSETVNLNQGDRILFYTDGITEAENNEKELYGMKRLRQFIVKNHHFGAEEFNSKLVEEIEIYSNQIETQQTDDITSLVVEII